MKVLDFESSVLSIEKKIQELRDASAVGDVDVANEISKMQAKVDRILKQIYQKLTPWQKVQVARHPDRPKFLDYLHGAFQDFVELSGDRLFSDDGAIICGFARISGEKCIVIGQEKGHDTESRLKHNFGMPKPEGYRKVCRMLELADKFSLPIISFIDTAGAFPGIESEERGQAEAIAKSMEKSFEIKAPFISIIIGEGGSGGAIAMAASDYVLMLEHAIYSVISPEGCASILWKDDHKANLASEAQKITATDLLSFGVIDKIIQEPIGGAHRNKDEIVSNVKSAILEYLKLSNSLSTSDRQKARRDRFISIGKQFVLQ